MINRYKDNIQKYNKIIDYINNHPNMSEDLRKEVLNLIQKFKIMISCMGEEQVYTLIQLSIDARDTEPLKKQLDIAAFGKKGIIINTPKLEIVEKMKSII